MYIETMPNRNSRPAIFLRQGWREGKRVRKKALANLTDWPAEKEFLITHQAHPVSQWGPYSAK